MTLTVIDYPMITHSETMLIVRRSLNLKLLLYDSGPIFSGTRPIVISAAPISFIDVLISGVSFLVQVGRSCNMSDPPCFRVLRVYAQLNASPRGGKNNLNCSRDRNEGRPRSEERGGKNLLCGPGCEVP